MCSPPVKTAEDEANVRIRRGALFGALSIALLTTASSLTLPHLQSRRDELGCDTMCYGSLTSARSLLAVVGSAVMGRLSDSSGTHGRQVCMLVGCVATLASILIAGSNFSVRGLWLSMIPVALLQQNFSILKALLSDLHREGGPASPPLASSVGMLGMAAGLSFMVGPLLGSTLLKTFEQANALSFIFALASLASTFAIPNPEPMTETTSSVGGESNVAANFLRVQSARTPGALLFMAIRGCMALSYHVFQTIWSVALKTRFNFGPADYGKFMSFIGLAYALSQGFLAKFLLNKLGGNKYDRVRVRIILACCIVLGAGRYLAYQTTKITNVYILFSLIVTALGIVNTIISADTSFLASSDEIGTLFGILASVESCAGVVGPFLGGSISYIHPIHAPLACVLGLYALVFALVSWGYERHVLSRKRQRTDKSKVI
jgi:hypothetical protein